MTAIIKVILYAFLVIGIAYLVPGISVAGFWPAAVIAGLIIALVAVVLRAIMPNNVIFGILGIILFSVAMWYIGIYVSGFSVAGYVPAIIGAVLATIGVYLINEIF